MFDPVKSTQMEILNFELCFHQDQDKVRPLSRLANLAITITDVQDMDPIFTNLPYSTNIEEDVPLVSNVVLSHCLLCNCVICNPFLSLPSFSFANMFHLSSTSSLTQLLLSHVHTHFRLFGRSLEQIWLKQRPELHIRRTGCFTPHPPSWDSPSPATYSLAGVGDCNYCGRFTPLQGCEAYSKGHCGYWIYLTMLVPMLIVLHMCEVWCLCVIWTTKQWGLNVTLPLSLLQVCL